MKNKKATEIHLKDFGNEGVCQELCVNSLWSCGKRSANSTVNRLSAGFQ
jgi:hypothetical protein